MIRQNQTQTECNYLSGSVMMNKKDKEKHNTGNKLLQQRNALLWKWPYKMKNRKTPP
jgi:hypothetical protein